MRIRNTFIDVSADPPPLRIPGARRALSSGCRVSENRMVRRTAAFSTASEKTARDLVQTLPAYESAYFVTGERPACIVVFMTAKDAEKSGGKA